MSLSSAVQRATPSLASLMSRLTLATQTPSPRNDKFEPLRRTPTPYALFVAEESRKSPGVAGAQLIRQASAKWTSMSEAQREVYVDRHLAVARARDAKLKSMDPVALDQLRQEFAKAKAASKKRSDNITAKKLNFPPAPPRSGFNVFVGSSAQTNVKSLSEAALNLKQNAQKWKQMSDSEKKPWNEKADQAKVQYKLDVELWKKQMFDQGREEEAKKVLVSKGIEKAPKKAAKKKVKKSVKPKKAAKKKMKVTASKKRGGMNPVKRTSKKATSTAKATKTSTA